MLQTGEGVTLPSLDALCVALLTAVHGNAAAAAAMREQLAGLFLAGTNEQVDMTSPEVIDLLQRESVREKLVRQRYDQQAGEVLAALTTDGIAPLVIKGPSLASLWPEPWMRPSGDLDLLVEDGRLADAVVSLRTMGFETRGDPRRRFDAGEHSVEFVRPGGPARLAVDLHCEVFRSVGSDIRARDVLARSQPLDLLGARVMVPDEGDRALITFVHAAKHAVRSMKWLLDCCAVAARTDRETWRVACARARRAGATRPLAAAAALVRQVEPTFIPAEVLPSLSQASLVRRLVAPSIRVDLSAREVPRSRFEGYWHEVILEDRVRRLVPRAAGMLGRVARDAIP